MKIGSVIVIGLAGVIGYMLISKSGFLAAPKPSTQTAAASTSGNQVVSSQDAFSSALGLANDFLSNNGSTTAQTTPFTT